MRRLSVSSIPIICRYRKIYTHFGLVSNSVLITYGHRSISLMYRYRSIYVTYRYRSISSTDWYNSMPIIRLSVSCHVDLSSRSIYFNLPARLCVLRSIYPVVSSCECSVGNHFTSHGALHVSNDETWSTCSSTGDAFVALDVCSVLCFVRSRIYVACFFLRRDHYIWLSSHLLFPSWPKFYRKLRLMFSSWLQFSKISDWNLSLAAPTLCCMHTGFPQRCAGSGGQERSRRDRVLLHVEKDLSLQAVEVYVALRAIHPAVTGGRHRERRRPRGGGGCRKVGSVIGIIGEWGLRQARQGGAAGAEGGPVRSRVVIIADRCLVV